MDIGNDKVKETGHVDDPERNSIPDDALFFDYNFRFNDGSEENIRIFLDPVTLQYLPLRDLKGDEWTRLEHHKCGNCPLDSGNNPHCPVALSIEDMIKTFSEKFSHESAKITVKTRERTYSEDTTVQKGISSMMGILMVSSGCPVMDKLRPMVRFHLPFPTVLETTFRTTSTYLLGQFFQKKRDSTSNFTFEGLVEIYRGVNMVNRAMAKRIRSMTGKDASVNALIILDAFATDVHLSIEDQIEELEPFFKPYFE